MTELDINSQSIAQLQHMGIELYSPIQSLSVSEFTWLSDLVRFLDTYLLPSNDFSEEGVSEFTIIFGNTSASLDLSKKSLHLPSTTNLAESDFKRQVWQLIKPEILSSSAFAQQANHVNK